MAGKLSHKKCGICMKGAQKVIWENSRRDHKGRMMGGGREESTENFLHWGKRNTKEQILPGKNGKKEKLWIKKRNDIRKQTR